MAPPEKPLARRPTPSRPADVVALLEHHPLAHCARQKNLDTIACRSVLDVSNTDRSDNFTTGTLADERCFNVNPAVQISHAAREVIAVYYLGPGFTGHKGYVHGGVIATILDECCGRAAICHFDGPKLDAALKSNINHTTSAIPVTRTPRLRSVAMTAKLSVDFIAPVYTDSCVIICASVQDGDPTRRKAKVQAQMWRICEDSHGSDVLAARADCLFIQPKL